MVYVDDHRCPTFSAFANDMDEQTARKQWVEQWKRRDHSWEAVNARNCELLPMKKRPDSA